MRFRPNRPRWLKVRRRVIQILLTTGKTLHVAGNGDALRQEAGRITRRKQFVKGTPAPRWAMARMVNIRFREIYGGNWWAQVAISDLLSVHVAIGV